MDSLLGLLFAYLLGALPFGLLIAKLVKGIDIREHGSNNIGATNVYRVVGKPWGILVFVLDALKGYLAVTLLAPPSETHAVYSILAGCAAILGHSFPVWLAFHGGKGVATSLGVFLGIAPVAAATTLALWFAVLLWKRILSLASLAAATLFPIVVFLTCRRQPGYAWLQAVSILLACFIFYTHRANIQRLKAGKEPQFF